MKSNTCQIYEQERGGSCPISKDGIKSIWRSTIIPFLHELYYKYPFLLKNIGRIFNKEKILNSREPHFFHLNTSVH